MQYPKTESLFAVDDQYLIGSDLLVKPVTAPGVVQTSVKFPTDDVWYDAESLVEVSRRGAFESSASFKQVTVPSDIDTIPVFQRGGSVIARKLRVRRSSHLMINDPYTIYVALDGSQEAKGDLYVDDEVSFDHVYKEQFAMASFLADFSGRSSTIQNSVTTGMGWQQSVEALAESRMIERIVVMGVTKAPASIDVGGEALGFTFDSNSKFLVIRKPGVSALADWQIKITF